MEPPKSKKKSLCLKFDDDEDFNFRDIPSLAVTPYVSASEHLKPATNRAKWHLPQTATTHFGSSHQAGSLAILGHVSDMSSELEVAGLARAARHFTETSF